VTHIVHAAADLRLNAPLAELRATNVEGVRHVLELARTARRHGLVRLGHVSTAYVAGARTGAVLEDDLPTAPRFRSAYEQSKHEGEAVVRAATGEVPVSVFRPGMIVGDARTGYVKTFNTVYYALRLLLTGRLRVLPTRPSMRLNLIPVDHVAEGIAQLLFDPQAEGLTFHLTPPPEAAPAVGELVGFVRRWARRELGVRVPRPLCVPLPERAIAAFGSLAPLAAYARERGWYDRTNTDRVLGPYALDWREMMPNLLRFAVRYGFLHRSERTVHEQALVRLTSRGRPVRYRDVRSGESAAQDPVALRDEILRATGALRSLGVRPGDRVALVGPNSTRYLILDTAIGLSGAVSVPLYYTSPPQEIRAILADSGARALFVGVKALLERFSDLGAPESAVSFVRDGGDLPVGVRGWESFLALGTADEGLARSPIGPDDLATLRYTSGTTGTPKGVMFRHDQLRWMAETLGGLLPWGPRTRPGTYLSFLPMNHVVEGILGTYAPHYLPSRVDVAFLDDFRRLADALRRVRPTVFFSVPRFYEKLGETFTASRVGRWYGAQGTVVRSLLRPLVRRSLLARAGLDRCALLISGSAPIGEALVHGLSDLGIEVHNAYGLTEAPLVTLNRHGRNRIGTVGEPLPETEVRLADDGEVLVRGPQVTPGYWGREAEQPFRDGWLLTGDLGQLAAGFLVITGRKKELLKTAYGKYVSPEKVEALLKGIPGVAEAMVVGEGRPFCGVLLWVNPAPVAPERWIELDRAVARINGRLSHPEQVKAWVVLANDLSIAAGELTANLKLRRAVVLVRKGAAIAALYGTDTLPTGVLHRGRAVAEP
jgi:long-chain acyl-CoA synthetase